jgi:hypothetical protein
VIFSKRVIGRGHPRWRRTGDLKIALLLALAFYSTAAISAVESPGPIVSSDHPVQAPADRSRVDRSVLASGSAAVSPQLSTADKVASTRNMRRLNTKELEQLLIGRHVKFCWEPGATNSSMAEQYGRDGRYITSVHRGLTSGRYAISNNEICTVGVTGAQRCRSYYIDPAGNYYATRAPMVGSLDPLIRVAIDSTKCD